MKRLQTWTVVAVCAVVLIVGLVWGASRAWSPSTQPRPVATSHSRQRTSEPTRTHEAQGSLPTISVADLPREGRETLRLIDAGGPFPYKQDGVVYQNRNRILPRQASGYYHEYTVKTPGSADRGARRIVCGQDRTCYYTADHYDSFARIAR